MVFGWVKGQAGNPKGEKKKKKERKNKKWGEKIKRKFKWAEIGRKLNKNKI